MSKCQKNKYAAGGKCGSMSGSDRGQNPEQVGLCFSKPLATFGEMNSNFAALLASREKQDALLFSNTQPPITQPVQKIEQRERAIVIKKTIAKSDIDTVLEGDF
jgi:hypothetical protein